jgi:hypothetical protein
MPERQTPTLAELNHELDRQLRWQAFRDGYFGWFWASPWKRGDLNINESNVTVYRRWYTVGHKWSKREVRRLRLLGAINEAYHRDHAPRELEAHRLATTLSYVHIKKRQIKTQRRFA